MHHNINYAAMSKDAQIAALKSALDDLLNEVEQHLLPEAARSQFHGLHYCKDCGNHIWMNNEAHADDCQFSESVRIIERAKEAADA
ncbi:hypothetical protein Dalk_4594 [Desulfatibacillum aliphaticivorans]|uniref:Uncharacterized protein n=1 Tax=Desulfatibacillum aliphaticivorans TaxID=218208 RepID=B8FNJ1_DESAL|nr:hypothetical protein [Desulfatibacillum aliphaticivorans]ACL06272.1 hypothetical protein Dalk_4594 [Desulfatibacillum aliphaticivorans]